MFSIRRKMKKTKKKPVAEEITSWAPRREIIYSCPVCGQSFRALGNKELFCHHCGAAIDWNVQTELQDTFSGTYKEEKELINKLNEEQLAVSPKTRKK